MRKWFWASMTCGVLVVGGAITTAHFAVHHPTSVVGRVLTGASYAAAVINPVSGLGPVLAQAQVAATGAIGEPAAEGIPEEPTPAAEETQASTLPPLPMGEDLVSRPVEAGPVVVANAGSPPIVIPEDDPTPAAPTSAISPAAFAPGSECPQAACAAPRSMAPCKEIEECEVLPMPREDVETLPMPSEENEEELSAPTEQPAPTSEAEPQTQDMKTPADVTPHADPCHPPCGPRCPSTGPGHSHVSHKAILRKIRLFTTPAVEDSVPPHPEVDTMEYRTSDHRLYDYGPGPL